MQWRVGEEQKKSKEKRSVGRPKKNPFGSAEREEEFARHCEVMIKRYYRPDDPDSKDFVFGPELSLSKTLFWALTFVYLVTEGQLEDNLTGFISIVQKHNQPKVTSDRSIISKTKDSLIELDVNRQRGIEHKGHSAKKQIEYRAIYDSVVEWWKDASKEASEPTAT